MNKIICFQCHQRLIKTVERNRSTFRAYQNQILWYQICKIFNKISTTINIQQQLKPIKYSDHSNSLKIIHSQQTVVAQQKDYLTNNHQILQLSEKIKQKLNTIGSQQNISKTLLKGRNIKQQPRQNIKNKKRSNSSNLQTIKKKIKCQQIKIQTNFNLSSQQAKENFKLILIDNKRFIQKIQSGQYYGYSQIVGRQMIPVFGISFFSIIIEKAKNGSMLVGVVTEDGKFSKNDRNNSVCYKIGKGCILNRKQNKEIGYIIGQKQKVTVRVNRDNNQIQWLCNGITIATIELDYRFKNKKLYPKVQMFNKGDLIELL